MMRKLKVQDRNAAWGIQMKVSRRLSLVAGTALVVLAGIGFHKVALAQSQPMPKWMAEEGKLPPDVYPDTLSRMPRPKESDYATDEEKQILKRVMAGRPERWLGPTGTRIAIAQLAAGGDGEGPGDPAIEPKYHELAVAAINREMNNFDEFINHEVDAAKAYGMDMEMDIINRKDTKGMDPKAAAIIEFARDLLKLPRTAPLSSQVFANLEKHFGRKGALTIVSVVMQYDANFTEMRAYDQHMDTNPDCTQWGKGGHHGCLDLKNPPPAWEIPTTYKPVKEQTMAAWLAEQAKLPPDVHPDTLSRMPRPQQSDFTNDKDKVAFNKIMSGSDSLSKMRWLGPMGTRLAIPRSAEGAERTFDVIHKYGGVDPKYMELTVAVATRENGDRQEFIEHEDDAIKAYGKELEDVVRLRKSTQGLDPKAASIIEFGRDLYKLPRSESVSSKYFADLQQNFGKKGALAIIALMSYYDQNWVLLRVYDQHMDTNPDCLPGGHHGCLNLKNPPPAW